METYQTTGYTLKKHGLISTGDRQIYQHLEYCFRLVIDDGTYMLAACVANWILAVLTE